MQPDEYRILQIPTLDWPRLLTLPSKHFRLMVLADVLSSKTQLLSDLAVAALERGMASFTSWGPGCRRFHDVVDQVCIADDLTERKFAGPKSDDVIMTAWEDDTSLEEALWNFIYCSGPTEGFYHDSDFWLVLSVGNSEWTARAKKFFASPYIPD